MPQSNISQNIFSIARNTLREAVRDRILYNLIIFVLLITSAAAVLGELSGGQEGRVIVDLGLSAVLIFGAFISIFVGVSLVWKEIEKKTVYAIFAKPISRWEFIVGKYLGLCVTLFLNIAVMALGVLLALMYVRSSSLIVPMLSASVLIYFELTILTGVAILFSSFSTPALSAMLTFMVFLIGHFSSSLREFAASMNSSTATVVFDVIYYALPNLSNFSFIVNAANAQTAPFAMIADAALYALIIDAVLLVIAAAVFSRRNFK